MKVALVYDRVNKWGGAERVLLALHKLFPAAPLYTSVYNPAGAGWAKVFPEVVTSFLQNFPLAKTHHELYAFLMPLAFESFDFSEYDLVISVTSEAAKGIITKPGTLHICYCLTPTRYLWSGHETYFNTPLKRALASPMILYLRAWDQVAAQRPDAVVGISQEVVDRIRRYYGRSAQLIYPPIDLEKFKNQRPKNGYFLVVSRLVPYKRVDLVVEVFNRLKWPLVIVGTGSQEKRLRSMSGGNIHFAGFVPEGQLPAYYAGCAALVMPQEEDFGMVAVEANAAGRPAVAYRAGGAAEIVIEGQTGIFFEEQTASCLFETIKKFSPAQFSPADCRRNAMRFCLDKFLHKFGKLVFTSTNGAALQNPWITIR